MTSLRPTSVRFALVAFCLVIPLIAETAEGQATGATQGQSQTILVFDASGSMWGQLAGKTKVEIAREAVATMLATWPSTNHLGLIAYGHREKGSCEDIEVLLAPGKVDVPKFTSVVNALVPKGKTPLTAAVKRAAEELKFTEQKATVILLSDGVETCDLDPCAVGTDLERLGIDFTAHVIGFDVTSIEEQASLRCLAENTGGMFIAARDASELQKALEKTTAPIPTPEPTPIPEPTEPPTPLPAAKLLSENTAPIGTELAITFDAPPNLDGYVYLYVPGKTQSLGYTAVRTGADGAYEPASLRLPAEKGIYELVWKAPGERILARKNIEAVESQISLTAPDSAPAGTEIQVAVNAPPAMSGYVYLYADGREKSVSYTAVRESKTAGYEASSLRLPATPGRYRLSFESTRNEVYAEKPLQIVEPTILLRAPDTASAGTAVTVEMEGPPELGGYVYLYPEGKDRHIHYTSVRENKSRGGYEPMRLNIPTTPGNYVIKLQTTSNEVLAERAIEALAIEVKLSHEATRPIATEVKVTPEAPEGLDGYLYLHALGKEKSITYSAVREGKVSGYAVVSLRLPATPGKYEIIWKTGSNEVLSTSPLEVTPAEISLKLPETVVAGGSAQVGIEAPEGIGGYLHVFGAIADKSLSYHRVAEGRISAYDPVRITVPKEPGRYVAKWITPTDETIAEVAFQVVEPSPAEG